MNPNRVIPRMFHRRLLLLAGGMLLVVGLLGAQGIRLSVVDGAESLARAETPLHRATILPTYRGRILDRNGNVLAHDRPGYAVAVDYDVITGAWEITQARRQARRELGRQAWNDLSEQEQTHAARARLPAWRAKTDRIWGAIKRYGAIDADELGRRREEIQDAVERLAQVVWKDQRRAEIARYGGDEETYEFRRRPIIEQEQAHVLLPAVNDEVAFRFRRLAEEGPAVVSIVDARRREQPWSTAEVRIDRASLPRSIKRAEPITVTVEGVADHLLGGVRAAQAEEVARRPFRAGPVDADLGGYRDLGDTVGDRGIERAFEDHLRGTRGEVRRRLDVNDEKRLEPVHGLDLTLTLDVRLQARVQALLDGAVGLTRVQAFHHNPVLPEGWPLNAAVVVLEVETGEILAMVSTPSRADGRRLAEAGDPRATTASPWVNRAAEAIYPPGSIIKPLVAAAAVTEGEHVLGDMIECTGHFFPDVTSHARCWIYREQWNFATHGALGVEDALGQSCNIFFYTLADRLRMKRLTEWYRRFGLGAPLEVGLSYDVSDDRVRIGESAGFVPAVAVDSSARRFDTIIMGIGQGPVTWTPLHAANAFATLARGGVVRDATLLAADPRPPTPRRADLGLDRATVAAVLEGLRRSVSPGGTGHHITYDDGEKEPIFNADGVTVWAKTGTAQAPPLRIEDTNGDGTVGPGDEGLSGLDHAWFVGLVGPADTRAPMFAIAVIVEYGGSGGRVAGPVANQVVRALQHEAYLPARAFSQARADR